MKLITLTRGLSARVSDRDWSRLSAFNWYAQSNGGGKFYAARDVRTVNNRVIILMHRDILSLSGILDGEHKDGDSLNNQRHNLRPATRSQNHANRIVLPKNKSCKFRGVSLQKTTGLFTAQISIENRKRHLGCFLDAKLAARAYDRAAFRQFGKFARLNFPKSKPTKTLTN